MPNSNPHSDFLILSDQLNYCLFYPTPLRVSFWLRFSRLGLLQHRGKGCVIVGFIYEADRSNQHPNHFPFRRDRRDQCLTVVAGYNALPCLHQPGILVSQVDVFEIFLAN